MKVEMKVETMFDQRAHSNVNPFFCEYLSGSGKAWLWNLVCGLTANHPGRGAGECT
jgi:hypothetical protein